MPYYYKVEEWSNIYAIKIVLGGSYSHKFKNIKVQDLVRYDTGVVRYGVCGGSQGDIYQIRQLGSYYCDHINSCMTYKRWLHIKRVEKLCNNNTMTPKVHGDYDPAYNYDYIYKTIIHNINFLLKNTSWTKQVTILLGKLIHLEIKGLALHSGFREIQESQRVDRQYWSVAVI